MKHLKYFENSENFKVGDIVKCINDTNSSLLVIDEYYKITQIDGVHINFYDKDKGIKDNWWSQKRFRLATPQEIEQLKYNL